MTLSDFQKTLVDEISAGKCSDIDSFLLDYCDLTEGINPGNFYYDDTSFPHGCKIYVPKDDSLALLRLKQFVSLWDKLERMGLIYSSSIPPQRWTLLPVYTSTLEPNRSILSIAKDFKKKEIITFPEISEFASRGYLTSEEYFLREENRDRKRAQRLTLIIAFVSIAATLFGVIMQYITYTTDRTVYVKNAGAFSDTTKVLFLNSREDLTDSASRRFQDSTQARR